MSVATPDSTSEDARYAAGLIARIVRECPRRVMGSDSERRAQDILRDAYEEAGADTGYHAFRWNRSLYAVLALHFGLATLGSMVAHFNIVVAFALHLVAGVSYVGDSRKWFLLLRRLFPFRDSQNLMATFPARDELDLRVVLVAHADAAYTGWLFHPAVIRAGTREPPLRALRFMRKSLLLATGACFVLAGLDAAVSWGLISAYAFSIALPIVSIPPAIGFLLNLQVVLRNEVVPGANDNLTGCAGGAVLARRLAEHKPDNVELVFVCTGAEEAGTGGAYALASTGYDGRWKPDSTVVVAIDGFSNGEMRWFVDGELVAWPNPGWLEDIVSGVRSSEPRFEQAESFDIPSGGTDACPFHAHGYDAMALGCVDPTIGAPRYYHRPEDTPENLDLEQLGLSLDFVEQVVIDLMEATAR